MNEPIPRKKFFGKRLAVMIGIAFVILILFCTALIKDRNNKSAELKELKAKLEEMESRRTKTASIEEEVRQISKYSSYEFDYTSVICHSDQNKFMGFDIPLTKNNFIATIEGKISVGIDADRVEFSVQTDSDGNAVSVRIFVPRSKILDNYPIPESLEVYDETNNIFNPVKASDYNDLLVKAKEQEEARILESDLLQKSDEAVERLLKSFFRAVYGNDITIDYIYEKEADE